jgi:flavin reductase (DIM6/NTAB) family NADH-FMN oxidoreductase RutF
VNLQGIADVFAQADREVWLLTTAAGHRRGGLIATFVVQGSIVSDLPRVLVGVARQHHTWGLIEASGAFTLHLLGEEHLDWVWRFGLRSGREIDKLEGLRWQGAPAGAPCLTDARGWLNCRVEARLETGDRTVYLAEVQDGLLARPGPLLTVRRMLELAPPERLRELKEGMVRDSAVDASAIRAWREADTPPGTT